MPSKRSTLDLAAFLDSTEGRALARTPPDAVRRIAEAFLAVCREELGRPAEELDGQELEQAVAELLPGRFRPRDPDAQHVPAVLEAYLAHLAGVRVVTHAFERARALDEALPRFLEAVQSGANAERQVRSEQAPFRHGATKLGRNDPCSCGSGKKFKHCHGKPA